MTIKPIYFTLETITPDPDNPERGIIAGPVRVLAADKIAAEGTCRKQHWDYTDSPRIHLLMGYYAMRRLGYDTGGDDFTAFEAIVSDFAISNTLDDDQDPTAPGSSS